MIRIGSYDCPLIYVQGLLSSTLSVPFTRPLLSLFWAGTLTFVTAASATDFFRPFQALITLAVQLDGRSMSLESGRYMETVGWMSKRSFTSSSHDIDETWP